jgi:hypothetical protein
MRGTDLLTNVSCKHRGAAREWYIYQMKENHMLTNFAQHPLSMHPGESRPNILLCYATAAFLAVDTSCLA